MKKYIILLLTLFLFATGRPALGMQSKLKKIPEIFARKKVEKKFKYYTIKEWVCPKHGENEDLCDHLCDDLYYESENGLGLSVEEAHTKVEEEYKKLVRTYEGYEKKYSHIIKKNKVKTTLRVSGGLDYSMTLNKMKQYVKNRFLEIKKKGLIITRAQFEKIKDTYFLKADHYFSRDLTRIWGIEHVKLMIEDDEELRNAIDVPDYVIVVDNNSTKHMYAGVDLFPYVRCNPQISPIVSKLKNANIYFEYIDGKDVTKKIKNKRGRQYKLLEKLHFTDFGADELAGQGNILEKNGKLYIVDTERRSFGGWNCFARPFVYYLHDKFAYNNNLTNKSDKIKVKV